MGAQRCTSRDVLFEILLNLPLEEEETPRTSYAAVERLTGTGELVEGYSARSKGLG